MLPSRGCIISVALAAGMGGAHAQTAAVDPQARQALDAMMAAYPALHSYSATVEVTDTDGYSQKTRIVFRRPNEAVAVSDGTGGHTQVVSDGTNLYLLEPPTKLSAKPHYHTEPSDAQADGVTTVLRMSNRGGSWLTDLVTDNSRLKKTFPPTGLTTLTLGPEEKTDGVPTQTVIASWKDGAGEDVFTFSIGKSDHLLRRLDMGAHRLGKPVLVLRAEKYMNVEADPKLDAATFRFTPPAGSKITH